MTTNSNTAPRLTCEALEARDNPAGNVSVAVFGASIFVQGDNEGNHVRLDQDGFGNVFITGINGTTVNGQGGLYLGAFTPQDVVIHGAGGSDTIEVFGLQAVGTLAIAPGDEFDRVDLGGVSANVVDLDAGAGNDTVVMDNVAAWSYLRVEGGADYDLLHFNNVWAPAGSVQGFEQMI